MHLRDVYFNCFYWKSLIVHFYFVGPFRAFASAPPMFAESTNKAFDRLLHFKSLYFRSLIVFVTCFLHHQIANRPKGNSWTNNYYKNLVKIFCHKNTPQCSFLVPKIAWFGLLKQIQHKLLQLNAFLVKSSQRKWPGFLVIAKLTHLIFTQLHDQMEFMKFPTLIVLALSTT